MRMMVDMEFPLEPFNTMVKNGTAGKMIQKVMEAIKPEATYFCGAQRKARGDDDRRRAGCVPYSESRRALVSGV